MYGVHSIRNLCNIFFKGKIVSLMNKSVCDECKLLSDFFFIKFVNVWWTIWSGICAIFVSFRLPAKFKHVVFCENSIQSKNLRLIQCEYLYMAITSIVIDHFSFEYIVCLYTWTWSSVRSWIPQCLHLFVIMSTFKNFKF